MLVHISSIGKRLAIVALLAGLIVTSSRVAADQGQQTDSDRQRISALEAGQKAILNELQEIKALLQKLTTPPAAVPQPPPPADLAIEGAAIRGRADAKITMIEFSDFECPFCARYVGETYAQIERDYVSTGKIRYVYRNFPLERIHPRAMKAAEAAECARLQGRFWEFHGRLFSNQQALAPADLVQHARALGLNTTAFEQCFAGQAAAKVRQDLADGARAGITGTPTFFIGTSTKDGKVHVLRKLVGTQPFANFKAVFDELLGAGPAVR